MQVTLPQHAKTKYVPVNSHVPLKPDIFRLAAQLNPKRDASALRNIFPCDLLLRSRFASEFLYMANGTGFGTVRVVQEYSNVTPKCPYKKII